jgi:hypothetical protein
MRNEEENPTSDLSKLGAREWKILEEMITAKLNFGLPNDFSLNGLTIAFNTSSGNVFFTNEDMQAAMLNGNKLESFYYCPECGHEGFLDEMEHNPDNEECQSYLTDIKNNQ